MRSQSLWGALGVLVMVLAPAGVARAGTYDVWSCSNAAGSPVATEGWTSDVTLPAGVGQVSNSCAPTITTDAHGQAARATGVIGAGGAAGVGAAPGLQAAFVTAAGVNYVPGFVARWTYTAPAGTTLAGFTLTRQAYGAQSPASTDVQALPTAKLRAADGAAMETCETLFPPSSSACSIPSSDATVEGLSGTTFSFSAGCWPAEVHTDGSSPGWCKGDGTTRALYAVSKARITLRDDTPPAITTPSGTLVGDGVVRGAAGVAFNATDAGGGVLSGRVLLDGALAGLIQGAMTKPFSCTPELQKAGFERQVPCPTSLPVATTIDTTVVLDGKHTLSVELTDAAGNTTTAFQKAITIGNHVVAGAANGAGSTPVGGNAGSAGSVVGGGGGAAIRAGDPPVGAANGSVGVIATGHFATKLTTKTKAKGRIVSASYGSTLTLRDRLLDSAGHAIQGAVIDVLGPGGSLVATATTDAKGGFTYAPSTTADSTLTFAYSERVGSGVYLDRRVVNVHVEAGVTIALADATAHRGDTVKLSGKVTAGTLPKKGARVEIRVKQNGRWYLAAVPRTDQSGNFTWSHRYRTTGSFTFQAHVLSTDGLSVRPGRSAPVRLRVL